MGDGDDGDDDGYDGNDGDKDQISTSFASDDDQAYENMVEDKASNTLESAYLDDDSTAESLQDGDMEDTVDNVDQGYEKALQQETSNLESAYSDENSESESLENDGESDSMEDQRTTVASSDDAEQSYESNGMIFNYLSVMLCSLLVQEI